MNIIKLLKCRFNIRIGQSQNVWYEILTEQYEV